MAEPADPILGSKTLDEAVTLAASAGYFNAEQIYGPRSSDNNKNTLQEAKPQDKTLHLYNWQKARLCAFATSQKVSVLDLSESVTDLDGQMMKCVFPGDGSDGEKQAGLLSKLKSQCKKKGKIWQECWEKGLWYGPELRYLDPEAIRKLRGGQKSEDLLECMKDGSLFLESLQESVQSSEDEEGGEEHIVKEFAAIGAGQGAETEKQMNHLAEVLVDDDLDGDGPPTVQPIPLDRANRDSGNDWDSHSSSSNGTTSQAETGTHAASNIVVKSERSGSRDGGCDTSITNQQTLIQRSPDPQLLPGSFPNTNASSVSTRKQCKIATKKETPTVHPTQASHSTAREIKPDLSGMSTPHIKPSPKPATRPPPTTPATPNPHLASGFHSSSPASTAGTPTPATKSRSRHSGESAAVIAARVKQCQLDQATVEERLAALSLQVKKDREGCE